MASGNVSIFNSLLCQRGGADKLEIRKCKNSIQAVMGKTDAVVLAREVAVLMGKRSKARRATCCSVVLIVNRDTTGRFIQAT